LSASSPKTDSKIHHETWKKFGKHLEKYIESHKMELDEESYDVILGFSRGGTILAYAFACLLKDSKSAKYSNLTKASVRSIPGGMTYKKSDPCFVMDLPASRQERDDIIKYLKRDLENFSIKHNDGKPINVLIMDDNLTGATRVKFLQNILNKMVPLVQKHNTLAYIRHKAFLEDEIPTIRSFPRGKDIFVMPWHKPHEKKYLKLKHNDIDLTKLVFRMGLNTSAP
jgi:hypoxanthine phosphoribosyltransferase